MGAVYAQVSDLMAVGRTLINQQAEAAGALLTQASARLRLVARKNGVDLDAQLAADEDYALAVRATSSAPTRFCCVRRRMWAGAFWMPAPLR